MVATGGLVTLRPREFHLYGELWHELLHLLLGVSAYIANFGFFTIWEAGYVAGDSMYFANNIIEIFLNLHSIHESRAFITANVGKLEHWKIGNARREVRDSLFYLMGSFCFMLGALLFEPFVYEACSDEDTCLFFGGLLFTFGSFAFAFGSFLNTLGVSIQGCIEQQNLETQIATTVLGLNVLGSALYLMGSPFYMPQTAAEDYTTTCTNNNGTIIGTVMCAGTEWPATNTGTTGYVLGGTFFLVAKVLKVWLTVLKHNAEEEHKSEAKRLGVKREKTKKIYAEPRHIGPANPREHPNGCKKSTTSSTGALSVVNVGASTATAG